MTIAAARDEMRDDLSGEGSRVDTVLARLIPVWEGALSPVLGGKAVAAVSEFLVFGIKQAWACLFGGIMLAALCLSSLWWPEGVALSRYDGLFLFAVLVQLTFLATGFERPREGVIILIFHVVGTAMEVFKTAAGSWVYPELSLFRIGGVPLFSGFMYACVGSYLARVGRVFDFQFTHYPPRRWTLVLGVLIYLNFFTHHYIVDIRWGLFLLTAMMFARTVVYFRVWRWEHRLPLLLGFFLVALFIWIAENVGTLTGAWLYPDQSEAWKIVSFAKMGSWYLLMIISWVLVTLVHKPRPKTAARGG